MQFAEGEMSYKDISVSFNGFPYETKKGKKKYINNGFGWQFINEFYSGAAFPVSKNGLFRFSKQRCFCCNKKLPNSCSMSSFSGSMMVMGFSHEVNVFATSVKCEKCGLKQINADYVTSDKISEAFAMLINELGIKP